MQVKVLQPPCVTPSLVPTRSYGIMDAPCRVPGSISGSALTFARRLHSHYPGLSSISGNTLKSLPKVPDYYRHSPPAIWRESQASLVRECEGTILHTTLMSPTYCVLVILETTPRCWARNQLLFTIENEANTDKHASHRSPCSRQHHRVRISSIIGSATHEPRRKK